MTLILAQYKQGRLPPEIKLITVSIKKDGYGDFFILPSREEVESFSSLAEINHLQEEIELKRYIAIDGTKVFAGYSEATKTLVIGESLR